MGSDFGMALDNFHCILDGKIIIMFFSVFVLSCVLVFCNNLYIQYRTSSVCHSIK